MGKENRRDSSLELMRIIAMLMVCAYHWQLHGVNDGISKAPLSANQFVSFLFGSWGGLGVNLFFLLSFYFIIDKEKINYRKIVGLIIKVSLYGTTVLLLAYALNITQFRVVDTVKSILGVFAYQYWFITVYVIIMVISPYLNRLLHDLSKHEIMVIWAIQFYVTYIISWILGNELVGRLSCGLTLYTSIYIIKKGIIKNYFQKYRYLGPILLWGGVVMELLFSYLGSRNSIFYKLIGKIQIGQSPYMFILSLFIFYCFKELKLGTNSIINRIAKYSSGAYLLHGGVEFLRGYLWDGLFQVAEYYHRSVFVYILHYLFCIIALFFVGVFVEYLYTCSVDQLVDICYYKLTSKISKMAHGKRGSSC